MRNITALIFLWLSEVAYSQKKRKNIATSGKPAMKGYKWTKKNELLERKRRRKGVSSQGRNGILLGNRRKWRRIKREMFKYKERERTE